VIAALALGAIVLFGRMYVGAHLPLDVIGGAALGAIVGSVVNLVVRPRALPGEIEPIEPIPPPATNDRGGRLPRWPGGSDGSTVGVDGRRGSRAR
jgi:membrane-associated phospholipid phosphatase